MCFFQDEPSSDPAEQKADQREEVETRRPEDKQEQADVAEFPTAQVFAEALETRLAGVSQHHLFC